MIKNIIKLLAILIVFASGGFVVLEGILYSNNENIFIGLLVVIFSFAVILKLIKSGINHINRK